jgi:hypothetical protein
MSAKRSGRMRKGRPMTEAEWLGFSGSGGEAQVMEFLRLQSSDRKLRLFAVACCRRITPLISEEECRRLVAVTEAFADGMTTEHELAAAEDQARNACRGKPLSALYASIHVARPTPWWLSIVFAHAAGAAVACDSDVVSQALHQRMEQTVLLRDIFGNPFHPVAVDPSWLTSTVVALARGIYEGRAFDRMPILADALQDAGCDNEDILTHCRGPGPHVRGCWVVDLVLNKE